MREAAGGCVLAPVAVTGADVPEVLLALVDVVDPLLHSVCGEHLPACRREAAAFEGYNPLVMTATPPVPL